MTDTGELLLDGVDDYVDLPNGLLSGLTDVTIEAWVHWTGDAGGHWQRIFDFGTSAGGEDVADVGSAYLFVTPRNSTTGRLRFGITTGTELTTDGLAPLPAGVTTHVAVTLRHGDRATLFQDGAFLSSTSLNIGLPQITFVNNWLGRSQFGADPFFAGSFVELRIYDHALSEAEVAASFSVGPELPGLYAMPSSISLATGGTQSLFLSAGPSNQGLPYIVLGSLSGTTPGVALGGGSTLPLNFDSYTLLALNSPNVPPFSSSFGNLDTLGQAMANVTLPAGLSPSLAGAKAHHAFAVIELLPTVLQVPFASNATSLTFAP